jgi:hypothetical protein
VVAYENHAGATWRRPEPISRIPPTRSPGSALYPPPHFPRRTTVPVHSPGSIPGLGPTLRHRSRGRSRTSRRGRSGGWEADIAPWRRGSFP